MHRFFVLSTALIIALSGCSVSFSPATPTSAPTPTPTITRTPTVTWTPTMTSTPTATATLVLPLSKGTPLPNMTQRISPDNAARLQQFVKYATNLSFVRRVGGGNTYLATTEDIEIYNNQTGDLINIIPVGLSAQYGGFNCCDLGVSDNGRLILVNDQDVQAFTDQGNLLYSSALEGSASAFARSVTISSDGALGVISLQSPPYGKQNSAGFFEVIRLDDGTPAYTWDGRGLTLHGDHPHFWVNNTLLTTEFDNSVWIWKTSDWSQVQHFIHPAGWSISPDGSKFAYEENGNLLVYDIATRVLIRSIAITEGMYQSGFTDDSTGVQLLNDAEKQYYIYNIDSGNLAGKAPYVNPDIITPPQSYYDLASWNLPLPQEFQIDPSQVDANNNPRVPEYFKEPGSVVAIAWHQRFIIYDFSNIVYGYSGQSNRNEVSWSGNDAASAVFSPDEKLVAVWMTNPDARYFGRGVLALYDTENFTVIWRNSIMRVTLSGFSPDGLQLILLTPNNVGLMQTSTPFKVVNHALPDTNPSGPAALSPDNSILAVVASTDSGEVVRLFNLADDSLLFEFQPFPNDKITEVRFSADGTLLRVVSATGWYKLWGVYP